MTLTPNVQATVDARRAKAIAEIDGETERHKFNAAAMAWLKAHGLDRPIFEIRVEMGVTAASLPGHKEAQALINTTMRSMWPTILERAIQNAENGNDEAMAAIKVAANHL